MTAGTQGETCPRSAKGCASALCDYPGNIESFGCVVKQQLIDSKRHGPRCFCLEDPITTRRSLFEGRVAMRREENSDQALLDRAP